ncbi:MAG: YicC family protein [Gammaproteobacteria bacterium]|nr:MAG: YicC family protein [Gammaproteobacteria bacterium]
MIRSMTGFARVERETGSGRLAWELRSVNHRYLEVSPRLPEEFRPLEPQVRERLSRRLARGKVEASLRWQPAPELQARIEVNEPLLKALIETVEQVDGWLRNPARIDGLSLLQWPGALREAELDMQPLFEQALEALDEAIDALLAHRAREGARLAELLRERARAIADLVQALRARRDTLMAGLREKLLARLQGLDLEADPQRLEQELAYIAQRLDVDEELDRLDSHLAELEQALQAEEPVGRRLDFLMQEFNREANTLGSKSHDAETTRLVVELKVLIEQMREQVQNIE